MARRTDPATIGLIRRMLSAGEPYRRIVEACGVGFRTVCRISSGELVADPDQAGECILADNGQGQVIRSPDETRPPIRCETCGAWIHPPCLACQVREWLAKERESERASERAK
jgi:hypothetical protein